MDPSATRTVPYQSFVQFRQCTTASDLIQWHRVYTPWMFLLRGNDKQQEVQKQLYTVYDNQFQEIQQKAISDQEKIDQLTEQILTQLDD